MVRSGFESQPGVPNTTIKVYAKCLRPDIEYKTLSITFQTSCREVVTSLLNKYRMRHRDPNLFYLTMEVTVRKAGEFENTVPAVNTEYERCLCWTKKRDQLLCSHATRAEILGEFSLQTRRGGLVKIYDSILMPAVNFFGLANVFARTVPTTSADVLGRPDPDASATHPVDLNFCSNLLMVFCTIGSRSGYHRLNSSATSLWSQYKSLLISDRTTVDELIQILLSCYNSKEQVEQFSLYEVCKSQEYQRKLHPDDCPLQVQQCWGSPSEFHFLIRRNLDFRPCRKSRKLLVPWTPELPTIPCSSRQNQPAPIQSSLVSDSLAKQRSSSSYTDYENYFYI
uniref:Ras-associating domain-containing protein n=1 Tax=Timema genevievae TaxID=629358 RepID=A0A7R9JQU3_TIMGE|nr:unnamed protein product [Timema genevievae]